jgi:hypothetical protein
MATRSRIGIQLKDKSVLSVYCHWDGYPEWNGKKLKEGSTDNQFHLDYDVHMAAKDPAHGILKSYYSEKFATDYIHTFLFDLNTNPQK